MLRESKGNMYEFVTHTWNPIKGKCMHECSYCYMKDFELKEVRLVEKEFIDLGENNTIFIGSGTDVFAKNIPEEWIMKIFEHCNKYPNNTYLFQSKNPHRMYDLIEHFPNNSIIGTTIETNRINPDYRGNVAPPFTQALYIGLIKHYCGFKTFITIEPIMDFDLDSFNIILDSSPDFVNIGADSKNNSLPEPSKKKILALIDKINGLGIKINKKSNLDRLLKDDEEVLF